MDRSINRDRKTPARATVLAALFALLLCGIFAAPSYATLTQDPFDGTNFQAGDGNQLAEGGHLDWQSIAGAVQSAVDPPDQDDPVGGFTGGS